MVNGLIKYHKLGQGFLLLNGIGDEYSFSKTQPEKAKMVDWNPLLVAIAYKRLEIVRYFLHDHRVAIRHAGKKPGSAAPLTAQESADQQVYCLLIAISNKDIPMLQELWN